MKTIAKYAAVAVLALGVPAISVAQDAAAGAKVSVNAMAKGSASNYGSLISSLQAGKSADLSAFSDSSTISFVTVSSLKADADAKALDNALNKNASVVAGLKTSIDVNAALKAKIEAAGYSVDKVVAITAEADGSFVVYVDDRA